MPDKHPNTERIGGPGSSRENRQDPSKSKPSHGHPIDKQHPHRSGVSGGGGEPDSHHTREPVLKGGKSS